MDKSDDEYLSPRSQEEHTISQAHQASLGIDVTLLCEEKLTQLTFSMDPAGFDAVDRWIRQHGVEQVHACLEATGEYGAALALALHEAGHLVGLVRYEPHRARILSLVWRNKTSVTEFGPFPVWIGVGGSPQSVIRAAHLGFSLMLAIIGGSPVRFAPFSQLFQKALERFGRSPLPVGVHSPGQVDVTDEKAREAFWPRYHEVIRSVSKTRGFAIPTRESYLREVGPEGALFVGSPETVAQKIATNLTAPGATRFD
jgi:hypothetical protein